MISITIDRDQDWIKAAGFNTTISVEAAGFNTTNIIEGVQFNTTVCIEEDVGFNTTISTEAGFNTTTSTEAAGFNTTNIIGGVGLNNTICIEVDTTNTDRGSIVDGDTLGGEDAEANAGLHDPNTK